MTEIHDLAGAIRVEAPRFACMCTNCRMVVTAGTLECPICGAPTVCEAPEHFPNSLAPSVRIEPSKTRRDRPGRTVEVKT